jgi:hypothetical protein
LLGNATALIHVDVFSTILWYRFKSKDMEKYKVAVLVTAEMIKIKVGSELITSTR